MSAGATVSLTLLQITDVHLRAREQPTLLGVDTWHSVNAVLDQALGERIPDGLLVTGDVAHDPLPAVYARFSAWLKERYSGPTLVLPGNHDVLARMGSLVDARQLELPGWTVLALDSHEDDKPAARVDDAEFSALQAACRAAAGEHLLVATHHPPLLIGSPWLDKDRIQNGADLLEWLAQHSATRAMVFGHAHQEIESTHRTLKLFGTPSTCIQFEPGSARFSVDDSKPGYRWLTLAADGGIESVVRRVEDYPLTIDRSQFNS